MESGFAHFGWRELVAVLTAVVIIVDWAAVRYGRRARRRAEGPGRG